jgi:gliding motility-associated lipoprotein GldH
MIFKIKNKQSFYTLPVTYCPLPIACCLLFIACCLLPCCTQLDTFEKNTSIPNYQWQSSFEAKGVFTISDTATTYNAYIVLRHTDAYNYNNIWLNVGIQPPADTMHYQKVDVQLGTDAKGWAGTGMNDIWEQRQLLFMGRQFKKPGNYNFSIKQIMRDDPLQAVMSAGLRVEKQ